mmetsp:Transcript_6550/g.10528  ORF Transcript_6550/g.10528 Transcript_6550/m.10528 type:complete len:130 (-) Transcript_6550:455-844(-)
MSSGPNFDQLFDMKDPRNMKRDTYIRKNQSNARLNQEVGSELASPMKEGTINYENLMGSHRKNNTSFDMSSSSTMKGMQTNVYPYDTNAQVFSSTLDERTLRQLQQPQDLGHFGSPSRQQTMGNTEIQN